MANGSSRKGSKGKGPKRQGLLSRSTILILSGLLIGIGLGNGYSPSFHYSGLMAGWVGLISFIALDFLAYRRREKTAERKREKQTRKLEGRMGRVIPRIARETIEESADLDRQEDSFVPVVSGR